MCFSGRSDTNLICVEFTLQNKFSSNYQAAVRTESVAFPFTITASNGAERTCALIGGK
jgi:hypothetical protein